MKAPFNGKIYRKNTIDSFLCIAERYLLAPCWLNGGGYQFGFFGRETRGSLCRPRMTHWWKGCETMFVVRQATSRNLAFVSASFSRLRPIGVAAF